MKSKGIRKIFRSSKSSKSIDNDVLYHGATTKCKRYAEPKETDLIFTNNGDKDRFLYALKSIFGCYSKKKVGIKKSKEKMPQKISSKVYKNWKYRLKESNMGRITKSDSSKSSLFTSSTTDSNSPSYSGASSMASTPSSSNSSCSTDLKHGPSTLNEKKASGSYFGTEVGMCLILVGLLVFLIWGKLIAIGCSSFGLFLVLLFNQHNFSVVRNNR